MKSFEFAGIKRKHLAREHTSAAVRIDAPSAVRRLVRVEEYRQCDRCVMDTSDPEITFDDRGNCCHCTEFNENRSKHRYQGAASDEALDRIVNEIRSAGKGKAYDCVIGVSGGVDSSYLAHIAKQKGLRPLAVHMDNGWNSDKAVTNIKCIADKLGLGYESCVLDWETFRDLQLAFLKASIPEAETPTDMAIPAALHRAAAKHNIKYILSGGNLATEGILPKSWHYNARDMKYFRYVERTFGTRNSRKFPTFGYKTETYYKLAKRIRMVYPLDYVPYVKEKAIELLADEYGWKRYGGKHHESRFTKFIQSYYLYEKFGIDYRRAGLSIQVLDGKVSRAEAIEQLKQKPYDPEEIAEEKRYISKKLGISKPEFESILSLPPKWYWDYPNDQRKLSFIYDVYRKLFKKDKMDPF